VFRLVFVIILLIQLAIGGNLHDIIMNGITGKGILMLAAQTAIAWGLTYLLLKVLKVKFKRD
jgi:hypothetical protein